MYIHFHIHIMLSCEYLDIYVFSLPLMVAELMSGYWVEEWLPQMMQPDTSSTSAPVLSAS
jgi:hypothetical protein